MSLQDKVVVITGGGTGLGADAAHGFRAAGAKVVLNGRREDVLCQTALSVDPTGENVAYVAGDIGRPEISQRLVETAVARFGGIDVLFNNAGVFAGELHAQVYATTPGARLAAVCDLNEERARQVGEKCGAARVYTDYHALLADPEVKAVSIVLPDFLHRDAVIAAAEAGKHILVEKPLATTEEDALAMIEAARAAGVTLFVDFHNRWSPLFVPLKQSLDSGELGTPQMVSFRLNDTVWVPTKLLSWAGQSSVAWFLASHCLDTLLWLMNARAVAEGGEGDTIERVTTVSRSRMLREEYGVDTPDFYLTTLEWRSGLVTHLENGWILPECGPSAFDLKCEFIGSRGAYFMDGSHHGAVQKQTQRVEYPDAMVSPRVYGRPVGFGAESIRHFAACVRTGQKPMVDGIDGLAVTRLILKMEESARLRQSVVVGNLYALQTPPANGYKPQ